jgi:hypothetical protein
MRAYFRYLSQEYEGVDFSIDLDIAIKMIEECRSERSLGGPTVKTANPFELICHWFSHEHIESYLSDKACLFIFRRYIGRAYTVANQNAAENLEDIADFFYHMEILDQEAAGL